MSNPASSLLDDEKFKAYYSDRHMYGFEYREHRFPFLFDSKNDFVDFIKNAEIKALWLSCLADLTRLRNFDFYLSRFLQWRHYG